MAFPAFSRQHNWHSRCSVQLTEVSSEQTHPRNHGNHRGIGNWMVVGNPT
jgi:hypothetical protein